MLEVIGRSSETLFGLSPTERLRRQTEKLDALIVADANAVLDDNALNWLVEHPETVIASSGGRPLAIAIAKFQMPRGIAALRETASEFSVATPESIGGRFVRKLRRRAVPLAISLHDVPTAEAERLLFNSAYKGVTDLVTKWAWPTPAFVVTKGAAKVGLSPNAITALGLVLTIAAGWFFFVGAIGAGLIAAWAMTFLDTVDGKLARVTVTSSRFGNWLDHGTDVIHPPLWWACLAQGLALDDPRSNAIWFACAIILGTYVLGRLIEVSFHVFFGFNGYLLSRFDARFRLIVARRNVLLLIMSLGLLAGTPIEAFLACAAWSVISAIVQAVRFVQAWLRSRTRKLGPYLV